MLQPIVEIVARQAWLDPAAEKVRSVAMAVFDKAGPRVENLLYGTWLGHPLHPVLTDLAIGGLVSALGDRKSTRLNSSHVKISYAVFCLKKKKIKFYLYN